MTGTPRPCYRSISIVADGRLEVCDGAHWAFVMKKIGGPTREKLGGAAHSPARLHLLCCFGRRVDRIEDVPDVVADHYPGID